MTIWTHSLLILKFLYVLILQNHRMLWVRRYVPALGLSSWPSTRPHPAGPCLSCMTTSELETALQMGSQQSRVEGLPSACWPCFFWWKPRYSWLPGLHIVATCRAFHPPAPQSPSLQGCFQSFHPPTCIDIGDCPNPNAGIFTCPCWTLWVLHVSPILEFV